MARAAPAATRTLAQAPEGGGYWGLILVVSAVQLLTTSDFASLAVMTPSIGRSLALSPETLTWVAASNTLAFASLLIVGGRLADMFGRRACCLFGLALFALGALLSGWAPNVGVLVCGRVLQGISCAVLSPANFSLLNTELPEGPIRNRAFGVFSVAQGLALIVGYAVGGGLTTAFGWRSVYLLAAVFAATILIFAFRHIPRTPPAPGERRIDLIGAALVTLGAGLFVAAPPLLGRYGWASAPFAGAVGGGILALVLLFLVETRMTEPLISPALFKIPNVVGANLAMLCALAAGGALFFLPNLYMQQALHFSAMQSGLGMLPQAAVAIGSGAIVTFLMNRFSIRLNLMVGPATLVIGLLLFALAANGGGYLTSVLPPLLVAACGSFLAVMIMMIGATASAPDELQGAASALAFTTMQIGMALGVSIALTIVAAGHAHGEAASLAVRHGYLAAAALAAAGLGLIMLLIKPSASSAHG
jgi:MFS family permease